MGISVGIMQPYFLPYIGYFQLIEAVDEFVVYDRIKYTKKGWINRNRMLLNGTDAVFSLPLKNASDSADVCERELAFDYKPDALVSRFAGAYRKAPYYADTMRLVERVACYPERDLFGFLRHSIESTCAHLGIETKVTTSSTVLIDPEARGLDRVLAICRALNADVYVNPIGGIELYARQDFAQAGVDLRFLRSRPFEYAQFGGPFVASLSIVDALMFNSVDTVRQCVQHNFDLV
jgi:hypothetical protein